MRQNKLNAYLQAIPKAELHIHFEGSMQPATLLYLAQKNKFQLPVNTIKDLKKWFVFSNFSHFATIYYAISSCLITVEDYEYATYKLGEFLAKQNIQYAEVTFTPSNHYKRGIVFEIFFNGLKNGAKQVLKNLGVEIKWIFDIERNSEELEKYANYTVDVAIEGKLDGVVALGLGGKEEGYPSKLFSQYFTRARNAGLHSVPHAGEFTNSANIWDAIELLHAERIGHGVMASTDEKLIDLLVKKQIPLEINPTSNIKLGIYRNINEHPLLLFQKKGAKVIIGSDDPSLFSTSLNDELMFLSDNLSLNLTIFKSLINNSVTYSFMNRKKKQKMLLEIENSISAFVSN